jgi:hypothetical protein
MAKEQIIPDFKIDKIVSYLSKHKENLEKLYTWQFKIDSSNEIWKGYAAQVNAINSLAKNQNFDREIQLKQLVCKIFNPNDTTQHKDLMNWLVKEWGGIKTGDKLAFDKKHFEVKNKNLQFDRIASYSKIAAFMFPKECIIYDSRVAYSLNWILLAEDASTTFFPIPEGRNSKMMAFDMNTLIHIKNKESFAVENEIPKKHISKVDEKLFIAKDEAYQYLNKLIKEVNNLLWHDQPERQQHLYYTEMLLFSIADNIIFNDIVSRLNITISK